MTIEIGALVDRLDPEHTVILFGAGSSAPSHAPTGVKVKEHLADKFKLTAKEFSLSEIASLVEQNFSRRELIVELRFLLNELQPTGGLLNLPLYDWKSVYTTNYDTLIEQSYKYRRKELITYSSNFDFTLHSNQAAAKLFKLHGTIEKDVCDGNTSRIVITDADYDHTEDYRQKLYDRLKSDLADSHLVIIGYSLADEDIKALISRAREISNASGSATSIFLLLYERDSNRAQLYEKRGLSVCFSSIDEFFSQLARKLPNYRTVKHEFGDPLDVDPALRPVTIDVAHAIKGTPDFSAMYNGWSATYSDILAGLTFERNVSDDIEAYFMSANSLCATLLGASGVGKTTSARQILSRLNRRGFCCWEHQTDYTLKAEGWRRVAHSLAGSKKQGVLLVDDAHGHIQEVNDLLDGLAADSMTSLKLLLVSTRNHWSPRIKSPHIFKSGKAYNLSRLLPDEIERLLNLVDSNPIIRPVVEESFSGFSRYERRRRLTERCESDMFVCLKNIFASEKFDDIILREYATLDTTYQDIYRHVAAMESAGIRVHRQLVVRLLGIPAVEIGAMLVHLSDIIHEYTINAREGLYGWKARHSVIASIIARYKYPDVTKRVELFSKVIDNISPTYDLEVRTVREMCNVESGLPSIPDKQIQNTLLRKMMSVVPGERVPRHRLIRNLIELGEFEKAETEIRIFEKDFNRDDGPVSRYKITLLLARASKTRGILEEDRVAILGQARALAEHAVRRFASNRSILAAYCDVGIEIYRRTSDYAVFDAAMIELKAAEERIGDPEITKLIARYDKRIFGQPIEVSEIPIDDAV